MIDTMKDFDTNLKRYIPQLYMEGKESGCGIFVGDLFITEAHIINPHLYYYVDFQGKRVFLSKKNQIFFEYDENRNHPDGLDLAIYRFENIMSPFVLVDEFPEDDTSLTITYYEVSTKEFKICSAKMQDIMGNYFGANTSEILAEGNSGSPIIQGNRVYGILNSGKPGQKYCAFLSSKIIKPLISR
jgi:hypothetical protein